jgi:hypothetical protein
MKVASITEAAISHGLKLGVHSRAAAVVRLATDPGLSAIALIYIFMSDKLFGLSLAQTVNSSRNDKLKESLIKGLRRVASV